MASNGTAEERRRLLLEAAKEQGYVTVGMLFRRGSPKIVDLSGHAARRQLPLSVPKCRRRPRGRSRRGPSAPLGHQFIRMDPPVPQLQNPISSRMR